MAVVLAVSMLAAHMPAGAAEENSASGVSSGNVSGEEIRENGNTTEQGKDSGSEDTGSGAENGGSENEGAEGGQEGSEGSGEGSGSENAGSGAENGSGSENAGSGAENGSGSENAGAEGGQEGSEGSGEGSGSENAGSGSENAGSGSENGGSGDSGNGGESMENTGAEGGQEGSEGSGEGSGSENAGNGAENGGESMENIGAEGGQEGSEGSGEGSGNDVSPEGTAQEAAGSQENEDALQAMAEAAKNAAKEEEKIEADAAKNKAADEDAQDPQNGNAGNTAAQDPAAGAQAAPAQGQTGAAQVNTAKVGVTWKDDDDANDIRPGYMTVYLQTSEDGKTYDEGTAYELNEKNNWQILLENLPSVKNGKTIFYRWVWDVDLVPGIPEGDMDEYNLVGYTRTRNDNSEDHLQSTREYTHVTVKEKYTIQIDWDDNGDDTAKRPKSLDVTLPDGRVVTLTAKNGWKMDIEMPIVHRDLVWQIGAADGWVSGGNSTDFTQDRTNITFTRKWKTKKEKETITTEEEVEEPVGYSTLTVQYWIGDESAAPSFTGVYENGQTYSVQVPKLTGYSAKVTKVRGKIDGDTVINVQYIPNTYTVTVYYRYLNGETAAEATQQQLKTGSVFDILSPTVNGYTVSAGSVSGTVTGRDLTYVVYYTGIVPENNNGEGRQNEQMINVAGVTPSVPAQEPDVTEIGEYGTPLGLGEVGINAGECFE